MQARANPGESQRASNRRLGLVLASIALVFFLGIVLKRWLVQ